MYRRLTGAFRTTSLPVDNHLSDSEGPRAAEITFEYGMNTSLQSGERICSNSGADPDVLKDRVKTVQLPAEASPKPRRFRRQSESCKISAIGLTRCRASSSVTVSGFSQ
jgi:hypothetical protein